jgi:hypothetical protein
MRADRLEGVSPSIVNRISKFARSEQGRRLTEQAKRIAKDPETRRKVEDARRRLTKRDKPH